MVLLLFWVVQSELHPCILGVGPGLKPCPAHSQRSCAAGCPVAGQGRLSQAEDMATMAAAARLAVQTCGSPEPKGCFLFRPNPVWRCEATFKDLVRWRERQQLPGCSASWESEEPSELGPALPAWVHNHRQRPDGLFLEGEDTQVQGAYSWCSQKEKVLRDVDVCLWKELTTAWKMFCPCGEDLGLSQRNDLLFVFPQPWKEEDQDTRQSGGGKAHCKTADG